MANEVPIGFTADGKLISAWRFTDAELSEMFMANEMYQASPDGRAQIEAALASLPEVSITLSGEWDG